MAQKEDEKLYVKELSKGNAQEKGVFLRRHFKKGEVIIQIKDPIVSWYDIKYGDEDEGSYLQIGMDKENKPLYMGCPGYFDKTDFLNHSCDPNAWIKIVSLDEVYLIALKNIKSDEEITFDYSVTMVEETTEGKWELENCYCGSKNCRKVIRDFKYLPHDIKKRYMKLGIVPKYVLNSDKSLNLNPEKICDKKIT